MTEQNSQPGTVQPQTFVDQATNQLYTVDPTTGQSVWVTDPTTGQPLKANVSATAAAPVPTAEAPAAIPTQATTAQSSFQGAVPFAATASPTSVPPQTAKPKKPFYKKWWFWLIVALLLLGLAGTGRSSDDNQTSSTSTTESPTVTSSSQEANVQSEGANSDATSAVPTEITVPEVVGKTLSDAYDELEGFNLIYQKADGSEADVWSRSNWRIDATDPGSGTTVPMGSNLVLIMTNVKDEERAAAEAEAAAQEAEARASIEYTDISAEQLLADLEGNAMVAKETYEGGNFRITGVVSNIDASGKYISIEPADDPWTLTPIRCDVVYDDTQDTIRQLSDGQSVAVCGEITSVGEIMGYSVDINRIEL